MNKESHQQWLRGVKATWWKKRLIQCQRAEDRGWPFGPLTLNQLDLLDLLSKATEKTAMIELVCKTKRDRKRLAVDLCRLRKAGLIESSTTYKNKTEHTSWHWLTSKALQK